MLPDSPSAQLPERSREEIFADLQRMSRRARPFLGLALLIIVLSLVGSIIYLDKLRRDAVASRDDALTELRKFESAARAIEAARRAPSEDRTEILDAAFGRIEREVEAERPAQLPLEQIQVRIWTCQDSAPDNGTHARQLLSLRPANATGPRERNNLGVARNSQPNYRLTGNEIRYNPDEEDAADRLQQMIRQATGVEASKVLTFFPSPGSVSVFFCEGANPGPLVDGQDTAASTPAN